MSGEKELFGKLFPDDLWALSLEAEGYLPIVNYPINTIKNNLTMESVPKIIFAQLNFALLLTLPKFLRHNLGKS